MYESGHIHCRLGEAPKPNVKSHLSLLTVVFNTVKQRQRKTKACLSLLKGQRQNMTFAALTSWCSFVRSDKIGTDCFATDCNCLEELKRRYRTSYKTTGDLLVNEAYLGSYELLQTTKAEFCKWFSLLFMLFNKNVTAHSCARTQWH